MKPSNQCSGYDMNLFSTIGIGLVGAILCVVVRQTRPEQAMLIGIATGCVIFSFALAQIRDVLLLWQESIAEYGEFDIYFVPLIRVLGITYLVQFASQVCRDAGENAIAMKMELAGKVVILSLSFPVLKMVLELIKNVLT